MIENLMRHIVDYAGLFPPAGLDMDSAVRNFAEYRQSSDAWILGRFVVPAARLAEWRQAVANLDTARREPCPLSLLHTLAPGQSLEYCLNDVLPLWLDQVGEAAQIDSLEIKLPVAPAGACHIPELPSAQLTVFWEVSLDATLPQQLDWIRQAGPGHAAKIRTGSVVAQQIPNASSVADFLVGCAERQLPFKATAGLHHPLRGNYPLTYEPQAPCGAMFGFLNVFIAALLTRVHGWKSDQVAMVLESSRWEDFQLTETGVGWGKWFVDIETVDRLRDDFAISFGSCSFREPVDELRALGWLPPPPATSRI